MIDVEVFEGNLAVRSSHPALRYGERTTGTKFEKCIFFFGRFPPLTPPPPNRLELAAQDRSTSYRMASYPPGPAEASPAKLTPLLPNLDGNTPERDEVKPMLPLHSSVQIDYESDEDEDRNEPGVESSNGAKRDSVTALLFSNGDGVQSRLEKDDMQEDGRPWYSLQSLKNNVKANEGFLLIASSQFFFAIINTLVKLLQQVSFIPAPRAKEDYFDMPSIFSRLVR